VSFRDDRDALAAQVDALNRELDELRPVRQENARLSAENAQLRAECARLAPLIREAVPPVPRRVAVFKIVGVITLLALFLVPIVPLLLKGKQQETAAPVAKKAVVAPLPDAGLREQDRLVALMEVRFFADSFDLPMRLMVHGARPDLAGLERTLARFEAYDMGPTGVPSLDEARAAYVTVAKSILPSLVAGDGPRPELEAASRRLRDALGPVLEKESARLNPFAHQALRFVDAVLDDTGPAGLFVLHQDLVAALEIEQVPWKDAPEFVETSRALLALVERRKTGGISKDMLAPLMTLQRMLQEHHAGTLRLGP
jgi:hypothetical protein